MALMTINPGFYQDIKQVINDINNVHVIICGHWNLVEDPDLDTYNYKRLVNSNKWAIRNVWKYGVGGSYPRQRSPCMEKTCGRLQPNDDDDDKKINAPKARQFVLNMKDELDLIDPWRMENPVSRRHTWRQK